MTKTLALAPKVMPCSSVKKIRIGPATTGKAPRVPAISEPHLFPTKLMSKINSGTVMSLSNSKDS